MRIILCAKQDIVGSGIRSLLKYECGFDVLSHTPDLQEAVRLGRSLSADLLVVYLPEIARDQWMFLKGVEEPGKFNVLVLTTGDTRAPTHELKTIDIESDLAALVQLIKQVETESVARVANVVREDRTTSYGDSLTKRELEVARLIAMGYSNRRIATELSLHEQSVKNLATVVIRKLKCDNRVQVALKMSTLGSSFAK